MAGASAEDTIPILKRHLLAVEHPCYVRDAERAIGMLGGVRAIAKASRDGTAFLECHLRPHDSLSHPLFGELARTPMILLKVRRKRRRAGAGDAPGGSASTDVLSSEVVGVVKHSYRFAGLADFQYVSSPQLLDALRVLPTSGTAAAVAAPPLAADASADEPKPPGAWLDESDFARHGCNVPPALFLSRDLPLDLLQLRPEVTSRPGQGSILALEQDEERPRKLRARRRKGGVQMQFGSVVDFTACELVPQAPKPAVQRQINPHDRLFVQMTARFAARPVWSRQALRASLGDEKFGDEKFKLTLPQLAYHFSNGPWRLCYIKYGYDPREHFDARIYQVATLTRTPTLARTPTLTLTLTLTLT